LEERNANVESELQSSLVIDTRKGKIYLYLFINDPSLIDAGSETEKAVRTVKYVYE